VLRASSAGSWLVPCFVVGCQLLTPYPGGGDPASALSGSGSGIEGQQEDPLIDPAIDSSVAVSSNADEPVLAIPGTAFLVDLNFTAPQRNVVGGGIRFPGSNEVQWTFINALIDDNGSMPIQFGYVVGQEVCDDVPNLCHKIVTEQFAVASNLAPGGDVDGDGKPDGEFVVSGPVEVEVVLMCATCESKSCQDVLPKGRCQQCGQPQVCRDYFERCLDDGKPNADTDEADLFETFFGVEGVLWTVAAGCAAGQKACEDAQERAEEEPDVCEL
jgi:hypothetical protein